VGPNHIGRQPKEDRAMPKYITFFSYTRESAEAMMERPSDRTAAAGALVESVGGKMEAFYWMHGKHDGFIIASYSDGASAAALATAAASTGAIAQTETHEIFDRDAQTQIMKAAKTAVGVYKPPTA
jgi:uncharacterized protein with GYD domain